MNQPLSRETGIDPAAQEAREAQESQEAQEEMLARVGQMTRMLHDNLRGLGFDKLIAKAAHDIPDARDRLDYVAKMTEQAAQRVLTATENAMPLQDRIETGANALAVELRAALDAPHSMPQDRELMQRTLAYLEETRVNASTSRQQMLDIMMAQDFQDLTGQVIKKVTELAHGIEQQLVQLLLDYSPQDMRRDSGGNNGGNGLLNGPQINPAGNADVVSDQGQVDDLLESLGF
ncbi:protein phosphatase CheZ [Noviherbaspirillum aerium]|uniref:protein phosphatase CheZ n=1 Tax=Noviherbaspirillum aerium TaxID=2588497 RepID=UPI001CEF8212